MRSVIFILVLLFSTSSWGWIVMVSNSGDDDCPSACLLTLQGNHGVSFTFNVSTRTPSAIPKAETDKIDDVLQAAGYEESFSHILPNATILDNVSNSVP